MSVFQFTRHLVAWVNVYSAALPNSCCTGYQSLLCQIIVVPRTSGTAVCEGVYSYLNELPAVTLLGRYVNL
jgi:hypothetical protein